MPRFELRSRRHGEQETIAAGRNSAGHIFSIRRLNTWTRRQRLLAAGLLLVALAGVLVPLAVYRPKAEAAWYNSSWLYRRKITFDNSAATVNLINFPVLVSLTSGNVNYANTQNSGQDIRFTDSDGTTLLSHEIEIWNESATSTVWVKVPQLDSGSTSDFIYMYYGNAGAGDGQDISGVWDSSFKAVYHLDSDPTAACASGFNECDSTANANNTVSSGGQTAADLVTGQIGKAVNFDGSNDFLQANHSASLQNTTSMTYDVWGYWRTNGGDSYSTLFEKGANDSSDSYGMHIHGTGSNNITLEFNDSSGTLQDISETTGTATFNAWQKLTIVYDDANNIMRVYRNGAQVYSQPVSVSLNQTYTSPLYIGKQNKTGATNNWDGDLDELRISGIVRSPSWIKAEYLTETNAINSFGAEESYLPAPVLTAFSGVQPTTPVFKLRGSDPVSPSYLRYKIDVCSDSSCSTIVRTIDETASQTGWTGQDAQTGTAYAASSTLTSSTLASHTYQGPALSMGTNYWWRGYSIDPSGTNVWSDPSAISSFTTASQNTPAAPTLINPVAGATAVSTTPAFTLRTTDADNDYLRYKIQVCSDSACSSVLRTIDQTASQTGWTGQDTQAGTAYVGNATLTSSTIATHTYQVAALAVGTQYWWRAYAIDPGGSNAFSTAAPIRTFTTAVAQAGPAAPTLVSPIGGAGTTTQPTFQLRSTDANGDYLRYKIDVCSNVTCASVLRTIDQTASQTGWTGQDTQAGTAYAGGTSIGSSTIASHVYQPTLLSQSVQYWWRAYAIDPGGSNAFSAASSIATFTTSVLPPTTNVHVYGGTDIKGGANFR